VADHDSPRRSEGADQGREIRGLLPGRAAPRFERRGRQADAAQMGDHEPVALAQPGQVVQVLRVPTGATRADDHGILRARTDLVDMQPHPAGTQVRPHAPTLSAGDPPTRSPTITLEARSAFRRRIDQVAGGQPQQARAAIEPLDADPPAREG